MILYTHFNENLPRKIPVKLNHYLSNLKNMVNRKEILMGTTSRILKYWEVSKHITFEVQDLKNKVIIVINDKMYSPAGKKSVTSFHLSGLTFYIKRSKPHEIIFKNKLCRAILNPPDETGKESISIPWEKLEYPEVSL